MTKYNLRCDACGATCVGEGCESGPGPGVELDNWPIDQWQGGKANCAHVSFTIVDEIRDYDDDDFYQR